MGLRTWRYGPITTSCCVGDQGASVPLPTIMNNRIVIERRYRPYPISTNPNSMGTISRGIPSPQPMRKLSVAQRRMVGMMIRAVNGNMRDFMCFTAVFLTAQNYISKLPGD